MTPGACMHRSKLAKSTSQMGARETIGKTSIVVSFGGRAHFCKGQEKVRGKLLLLVYSIFSKVFVTLRRVQAKSRHAVG